jgi:hypothetical protein
VLPDRSADSILDDRRQALPFLKDGKGEQVKLLGQAESEEAMISPETQVLRLLRKTANLLNSVAEAAWADTYLAQRDILDMLGQPGIVAEPQSDLGIAAALDEAAQTVATIPRRVPNLGHPAAAGTSDVTCGTRGTCVCSPACDSTRIGRWSLCLIMSGCWEVLLARHNRTLPTWHTGGTAP